MSQLLNILQGTLFLNNSSFYNPSNSPLLLQHRSCFYNGKYATFQKFRGNHFSLQGSWEVVDHAKTYPPPYKDKVCDGAELDTFPHIQTLRKFPKEELFTKVVMLLEAESVAEFLSSVLQLKVVPAKFVSGHVHCKMEDTEKSNVLLLENLSQFKEELANCSKFAEKLSSGVDIFVNDAFSQSHKIFASTVGVARFCSACVAGFHFEKGLYQLKKVVRTNKRPYIAIIGGGNLLDKVAALHFLASTCDGLVFVGMMAFQIMHALGLPVPMKLVEHGILEEALNLTNFAKLRSIPILFPKDFWCMNDHLPKQLERFPAHCILDGWLPIDLGPKSLDEIYSLLSECEKIIWIGPVKYCLPSQDTSGASKLALMLDKLSRSNCDITVVGNMACKALMRESRSVSIYNMLENASVVWEFLKGRKLPGLLALDRAYPFEIDWNATYADPARPLVVDIGSGNGLFLFRMARSWKEANFLGLEINEKLVSRCLNSVHRSGIKNGYFIATNATSTFRSIVSSYPGELVLVSIQCPNPDFNRPEHRWRMLQRALVEAIADLLTSDGKVFLQSDIEAVVMRMKEQFLQYGKGKLAVVHNPDDANIGHGGWLKENPFGVRSDWEQHVIDRGAPMGLGLDLGLARLCSNWFGIFGLVRLSLSFWFLLRLLADIHKTCLEVRCLRHWKLKRHESIILLMPNLQMEPQVSLGCGAPLRPENILIRDVYFGETPSSQNNVAQQQMAKKQTRQWAAWTRQEEESFFTALRQVGKNFEKITCRVQSKNKDQVRHYYYRLVRRMNKLLGPELCLDAKNSKDTNAAMLRWWSLLEKYSCKASKLHLKPRRFKIFVETLEHQLMKDRKKNIRKRPSQGENCSPSAPTTVSNQGRAPGHDIRAVKVVLVDSQNIQKLEPGKGSSLKCNVNIGINRSNYKGDSSTVRTVRQRQKPGTVSKTAYKRWEKAAIAGVSLVADAAEHLERTATDEEVEHVQGRLGNQSFDPVGQDMPPLPSFSKNLFIESNVQTPMKLKLQLFPIDESTRKALELENHNPHLELTLSTRKKISSVLEHLNRKWGNSSIASGELMLFPYCVESKNLVGYQRWTQDSVLSAADVYALIGTPPVFRLRYGWISITELRDATFQASLASSSILNEHNMITSNTKEQRVDSLLVPTRPSDHQSEKLMDSCKDQLTENTSPVPSTADKPNERVRCISPDPNINLLESSDCAPIISCHRKETGTGAIMRQVEDRSNPRSSNCTTLSAGDWVDSLTNVSVSDLLSEVSHDMDASCIDPSLPGSSQCLLQIPFSCDSFDAAIAAHMYRHQNKTCFQPALASHASSIWDAEETCDAFSFQNSVFRKQVQSTSQIASPKACTKIARMGSAGSGAAFKELPDVERPAHDDRAQGDTVDDDPTPLDDDPSHRDLMEECQSDPHILENSAKNLNGLTEIYWPDSLGPLDLDIPSCRYHSEDLILSDSLSGLNHLIASSLDAFQNCSFFTPEKKEQMASTVEARETASFLDYKIGSEV
ncbi:hypothetical protein F0562_016926 [Nyssa sinensis]|uniref:Phosphoglycerate kinase n=1 Tax=Nyssa sinensis TaxID=561372 RepID=A0A5J4ZGF9_9ASTE|nr:hypothetical protein F0562_016926 [Nyssa sinensis]